MRASKDLKKRKSKYIGSNGSSQITNKLAEFPVSPGQLWHGLRVIPLDRDTREALDSLSNGTDRWL